MGNNGKSNFGCGWAVIVIVLILALVGSCGESSSDYDSRYSYEYNTNEDYRSDVNDIADVYGEDPADVDRKINDVVDAMNGY